MMGDRAVEVMRLCLVNLCIDVFRSFDGIVSTRAQVSLTINLLLNNTAVGLSRGFDPGISAALVSNITGVSSSSISIASDVNALYIPPSSKIYSDPTLPSIIANGHLLEAGDLNRLDPESNGWRDDSRFVVSMAGRSQARSACVHSTILVGLVTFQETNRIATKISMV